MVHTLPDYTTKYKLIDVFSHIDEAELAVRLGSNVIADRRGNVIFMDDFEKAVLRWQSSGTGGRGTSALSTDVSKSGIQSCKMTTGGTNNDQRWLTRYFSPSYDLQMGYECSFSGVVSPLTFSILISGYIDNVFYQAGLMYRSGLSTIEIIDSTGANEIIYTPLSWYFNLSNFLTMKLALDLETMKYIYARFNNIVINLSTEDIFQAPGVSNDLIQPFFVIECEGGANKVGYIDDIIITQNE
jgi:hypothetical protein